MRQLVTSTLSPLTSLVLVASLGIAAPAPAQDKPRSGGELVFGQVWLSE